jgi:hypothetical protein
MVLGMILYEGVDLAYNIVRLGYNSVAGTYNWWYKDNKETNKETNKELIEEIKKLNNRVKELECASID